MLILTVLICSGVEVAFFGEEERRRFDGGGGLAAVGGGDWVYGGFGVQLDSFPPRTVDLTQSHQTHYHHR